MTTDTQIPPKSEWKDLSISQLYDAKYAMMDKYYNMRGINASFAAQYARFVDELDALIRFRETEKLQETAE